MPAGKPKAALPASDRLGEPRLAARELRRVLAEKVRAVAASGLLDKEAAAELARIGQSLAQLEKAGFDLKTAAMEVCERLADFAARSEQDPERKSWLADLLDGFFLDLDGGGR